jgi:hypothetical protein
MSTILIDRLSSWGFDPSLIKPIRRVNDRIPSPGDLVSSLPLGDIDVVLIDVSVGTSIIEQINQKKPVFVMSYLPLGPELPIVKKPIREGSLRSQLVKFFLKSNQLAAPGKQHL